MHHALPSLGLCLLALLASCGDNPPTEDKDLLAYNDFEQLNGWVGATTTAALTTEKAHSGRYCTFVAPGTEYGIGYVSQLSQLSPVRPVKIKISAWVLATENSPATIVTSLENAGADKPVFWEAMDLGKAVTRANEWQKAEKTITIPADANASTQVKVYPWRNNSEQPAYFDDIEIRTLD